jgi:hypothetical protein
VPEAAAVEPLGFMLNAPAPPRLSTKVGRSRNSAMQWSLENAQAAFAKMTANGWDTAAPLKWGFFFMHSSKEPLLSVFGELKNHAYVLESLHQAEDGTWVLQVSKTEILAADKLHRRNISFCELAQHCGVDLYDGWDAGKAE